MASLKHLPTLPHILLKLIRACGQEKGGLKDIAKIVEKDPALTGKILRLLNSPYYGLSRKLGSIEQAVAYLGTNALRNVAISSSIREVFGRGKDRDTLNMKRFWWHSLRCAGTAKRLAAAARYKEAEEAFLCGLLHDIGRLVLWTNFPKEYDELLERHKGNPDLLLAGEISLGANHSEVGAWLLERWNLSSLMADAVLYHHEPLDRVLSSFPLVQIVYAANALSREATPPGEAALGVARRLFGLGPSQVQEILSRVDEELKQTADSLGIEVEAPLPPKEDLAGRDVAAETELKQEVKDLSLLLGTLQNFVCASDIAALLREIFNGLQVLFEVRSVFIFLHDPERNALMGQAIPGDERSRALEDLMIPMQVENSLPVIALRESRWLDSFSRSPDPPAPILDRQIARFTGREGISCLPMIASGEPVGVIVLGLDQGELGQLSKQIQLLRAFADHAALALHVHRMRQAQLSTIQTERAGASSDMARRVVHEVNNPLGIIKNYLKILGMKLSAQGMAQDEIRIINEEIDRVVLILRELAAFTGGTASKIEEVDTNALLTDLCKLQEEPLLKGAGIRLQLALDPSLPPALADRNAVKQILINLLKNSAEAMTQGGSITLQTRHLSTHLGGEMPCEEADHAGCIEITVRDDGPGIPDPIKRRIFEPFITTKGGHSGLGLSIAYSLLKSMGGTITCESCEGKGTTFKVFLPSAEGGSGR
jgi:HD-like signal output (HDOD) protein/nitrogen-specific signal transduction histidine kinase